MKWRWLLAVIAAGSLVVLGMFLWWFGPFYATRGLGVWMVIWAPFMFVSYAVTRARWMVHAGYILIPLGMIGSVMAWPISVDTESAIPSILGLVCAVPFMLTAAWALSVFQGPAREGALRATVRMVGPVCFSALAVVALTMWATPEDRHAMPQYAANFAGCYALSFGRWIPGGVEVRRAVSGFVPSHLRLDDGKLGRRFIVPGWWGGAGVWTPTGPQDVELSTPPGLGGLELMLHRGSGDMLRGRARMFSDADDGFLPEPQAIASLYPEDCGRVSADPWPPTNGWTEYVPAKKRGE